MRRSMRGCRSARCVPKRARSKMSTWKTSARRRRWGVLMAETRAIGEGMIYDRGYRGYDGPRAGRASAVWALFVYSLRRSIGIGKRWTAKILPIALYLIAFGPVLLVVGLRVILGPLLEDGPDYGAIFGLLTLVVLIFGATSAPELLCDDRRQGVLPLYFSRVI